MDFMVGCRPSIPCAHLFPSNKAHTTITNWPIHISTAWYSCTNTSNANLLLPYHTILYHNRSTFLVYTQFNSISNGKINSSTLSRGWSSCCACECAHVAPISMFMCTFQIHLDVCVVVVVCKCEWVCVCRYVVLHEKAPTFNIGSVRINVNSHTYTSSSAFASPKFEKHPIYEKDERLRNDFHPIFLKKFEFFENNFSLINPKLRHFNWNQESSDDILPFFSLRLLDPIASLCTAHKQTQPLYFYTN